MLPEESVEEAFLKVDLLVQQARQRYDEDVKVFERMVSRVERAIYMRILEPGMEGLDNETLYKEMEEEGEGYPRNIVKAELHRLIKKNCLSDKRNEARLTLPVNEIPGARLMRIQVEKILQGEAVVIVDGKWHARLYPSDYNGPRQLIKKNVRFKALRAVSLIGSPLC